MMAVVPAFNAREVELIIRALPQGVDQRRIKLLPKVLHEWATTDLPPKLLIVPAKTKRARVKRLERVGNCAGSLLHALDAVEQNVEQFWIMREMLPAGDLRVGPIELDNLENQFFQEIRDFLRRLSPAAIASARTWKQRQGHPFNIVAAQVLMDIIAIYEWLTGKKATREVDRDTSKDKGEFWQFAITIWPLVFRKGEASLSATMRNWRLAVNQKLTALGRH